MKQFKYNQKQQVKIDEHNKKVIRQIVIDEHISGWSLFSILKKLRPQQNQGGGINDSNRK